MKFKIFGIIFLAWTTGIMAQPAQKLVKICIEPGSADWIYKVGDNAEFKIRVLKNGVPVKGITVFYDYGPEMMTPIEKGVLELQNDEMIINAGTLHKPGFLRLRVQAFVEGVSYDEICTVAFSPLSIEATVKEPSDFDSFWAKVVNDNEAIPFESTMVIQPDRCTDQVDVYHVSFQNYRIGSRIYGWLAVPKSEGPFPVLLRIPGAGVWKNGPDIVNAQKGVVVLSIGIHGIPLTYENNLYETLRHSALRGYWLNGLDDADQYYYKRVLAGCVKAVDFLLIHPKFDGKNVGVVGDSQGGALAVVTAALHPSVTVMGAYHPALCDHSAYLHGRAGGWPHVFKNADPDDILTELRLRTLSYYDVVLFAERLKANAIFTWGYNDITCPPTSMYAAYNSVKSPKKLFIYADAGHWFYPEQTERLFDELIAELSGD